MSFTIGQAVWTYYPVSKHFCWEGEIIDIQNDKVKVKAFGFEHLEDWFHISNVEPVLYRRDGALDGYGWWLPD